MYVFPSNEIGSVTGDPSSTKSLFDSLVFLFDSLVFAKTGLEGGSAVFDDWKFAVRISEFSTEEEVVVGGGVMLPRPLLLPLDGVFSTGFDRSPFLDVARFKVAMICKNKLFKFFLSMYFMR